MLKLREVVKTYRNHDCETRVLQSVNLDIHQGEFVAVMGPSGCGKSTLLNIMGLLDVPDSGSIQFNGQELARHSEPQLAPVRKKHVGFIFQNFNLVEELTVSQNIEMALLYQGISARERRRKIADVMDRVGIGHRAEHFPGQLSGGQQQRVAVARAVVADQSLILADEPTGNLDSANGQDVMQLLQSLNDKGTTIVMVTHSTADADYARRTIQLFDGRVLSENRRAVM